MDIRYSANQKDARYYDSEELREEFLIQKLYEADKVHAVYSHVDRMVIFGCMPVKGSVTLDREISSRKEFGTDYVLERREMGIFNIGGDGEISADGVKYELSYKDCLYVTRGTKELSFRSKDGKKPAKFYMVSAPAHAAYETKLLTMKEAKHRPMGKKELSNERVINQFIHPEVLKTAQLSMGLTELKPGSVWNTMPCHTHERRMEIYTYFELPSDQVVFHLMGEPDETRHIVMRNEEAVISPSWSIHSAAGTHNYSFIWAMGGENQEFDDMDPVKMEELR